MGWGRSIAGIVPCACALIACNAITGAADLTADLGATEPDTDVASPPVSAAPDAQCRGEPPPDAATPPTDTGLEDDGAPRTDAADAGADVGPALVFVTAQTWTGDLGGLAGADAKCNDAAMKAGLAGTFVAWLSGSAASASARLTGNGPWYLVTGKLIAASKQALLTQGPAASISRDEQGGYVDESVWTGTSATGSANGNSNCNDWSPTPFGLGTVGGANEIGPQWTNATLLTCGSRQHLYCFRRGVAP